MKYLIFNITVAGCLVYLIMGSGDNATSLIFMEPKVIEEIKEQEVAAKSINAEPDLVELAETENTESSKEILDETLPLVEEEVAVLPTHAAPSVDVDVDSKAILEPMSVADVGQETVIQTLEDQVAEVRPKIAEELPTEDGFMTLPQRQQELQKLISSLEDIYLSTP